MSPLRITLTLRPALADRAEREAARRGCDVPTWLSEIVECFLTELGSALDAPRRRRDRPRRWRGRLPTGPPPGAA